MLFTISLPPVANVVIEQLAINGDPYWQNLLHALGTQRNDKIFPDLKVGLFNPNGMSPVPRLDANNKPFTLNKHQVIFDKAKEIKLSILGLSETHHTEFPAHFKLREFSSDLQDYYSGGTSLIIMDKSISILPTGVV